MTRYVNQPHISGGTIKIKGGTNHKGMVTIKIKMATTVAPKDQTMLANKECPFFRSKVGNRRSATNDTMAGVIMTATKINEITTMMGVNTTITNIGIKNAFSPPTPTLCNQVMKVLSRLKDSKVAFTQSTAGVQKK